MRIVIQRVTSASVQVEKERVASIDMGLLLLVGFAQGDSSEKLGPLADKIAKMRLFSDENGRPHFSVVDIKGAILLVSQFTLLADTSKGRRPDFFGALEPKLASQLFEELPAHFKACGVENVQSGVFGAYMKVESVNDGPLTIIQEF